jgi:hypothetical protein
LYHCAPSSQNPSPGFFFKGHLYHATNTLGLPQYDCRNAQWPSYNGQPFYTGECVIYWIGAPPVGPADSQLDLALASPRAIAFHGVIQVAAMYVLE